MKKKNNLPDFNKMTYEAEANFWDTHDITDFEDETEDVEIVFDKNFKSVFELDKPRDKTLIVRLQKDFKDQLEKVARSKGLNVSTLARMWLIEKLQSPQR